jgi:hypothetical protein
MEPVPSAEITRRVETLQKALAPAGIGLALIRQAADLLYYAGTLVDGFLAVAPEGQPSLLVRRPHHQDHPALGTLAPDPVPGCKGTPPGPGPGRPGTPGRGGAGTGCHSRRPVQAYPGAALSRTCYR